MQISFLSGTVCPPTIVKPSSLNYKISLKSAVEEFVKKESKIDNYQIHVEECPITEETSEAKASVVLHEDLEDALYSMNVLVLSKLKPAPEVAP